MMHSIYYFPDVLYSRFGRPVCRSCYYISPNLKDDLCSGRRSHLLIRDLFKSPHSPRSCKLVTPRLLMSRHEHFLSTYVLSLEYNLFNRRKNHFIYVGEVSSEDLLSYLTSALSAGARGFLQQEQLFLIKNYIKNLNDELRDKQRS